MSRMLELETSQGSDEIDLRRLVQSIMRTRKAVVIALLVATAMFWGVVATTGLVRPAVTTYTSTLQLVFPGVAEGEYPNGSSFSAEDLVAPTVISSIYEANRLGDYFEDREQFARSISVRPYAPDRQLIIGRYQSSIDPKKMTPAELQLAQTAMREELAAASKGLVALSLSVSVNQNIPGNLIEKTLDDIPREWARQAIERRGVINLDVPLYSDQLIDTELVESMEPLIVFDYLIDKVSMVRTNVDRLGELANADTVRDPKSGLGLADLNRSLNDLDRYYISNLMVPLRRLKIAVSPSAVKFYFENKLAELRRQKLEYESRAGVVRETYNIYVRNEAGTRVPAQAGGTDALGGTNTLIPQLGDGFLDRLLALANREQDTEYRQDLTREIMELNSNATELDTQIARIEEIIESFTRPLDDESAELREYYIAKVEEGLPIILAKLREYLQVTQRIYVELSKENIGYTGLLYNPTGSEIIKQTNGGIITTRNIRWYLILLFLVVLITIPLTMLKHVLRRGRSDVASG